MSEIYGHLTTQERSVVMTMRDIQSHTGCTIQVEFLLGQEAGLDHLFPQHNEMRSYSARDRISLRFKIVIPAQSLSLECLSQGAGIQTSHG
jgi:hypothetical protein